jgi:hypothetical protein
LRRFERAYIPQSNKVALIEYADEDPEIRRAYVADLLKKGALPEINFDLAANHDWKPAPVLRTHALTRSV